jgi:hypothetical protein
VTRREVPLDAAQILIALDRHEVDYVLIGGMAVQAHGHVRTTQDADLLPAPEPGNLRRLAAALEELGARPAGVDQPPAEWVLDSSWFTNGVVALDTRAGGVDVHGEPPGGAGYEQVRARALVLDVAGARVPVAGLDDLIAMKRASGRPIDRGDILALTQPSADDN